MSEIRNDGATEQQIRYTLGHAAKASRDAAWQEEEEMILQAQAVITNAAPPAGPFEMQLFKSSGQTFSRASVRVEDRQEPARTQQHLPAEVRTPVVDGSALRDHMVWAQELEDAALLWNALSVTAQTGMIDLAFAKRFKFALQTAKLELKSEEIGHEKEKIKAEEKAAALALGMAITGCVAAAGMAFAGASHQGSAGYTALSTAGWQISSVFTSLGTAINKSSSGPLNFERQAGEHSIQAKELAYQQEAMEQVIEETKTYEDEAREQFRNALKALTDHIDRQSEIVRKITG